MRMRQKIRCPACGITHPFNGGPWGWNGDRMVPNVEGSLGTQGTDDDGNRTYCHLFITKGEIRYCDDSTHAFAGQTVDMLPFPDGTFVMDEPT